MPTKYTILFTREAAKQMKKIAKSNPAIFEKIKDTITSLTDDPRPDEVKKLKGYENSYRVRVGNYRILYTISDKEVTVHIFRIATRQNAY